VPTKPAKRPAKKSSQARPRKRAGPLLLAGGNPQIPKGDGDAPVRAYLAAVPGWKRALARQVDALITKTVPKVRKAVKWNSPFFGIEDHGWFLSYHCFDQYLKVTFFRGRSLDPVPPGESKHPQVRYLDIRENEFDAAQFVDWVNQASQLPGEKM